ncbi:O-fucosyltransferase 6 [Sesamum angolense]|uniref:O-fucosyltransferase family protein n=1 Tax=Sesamum angolense TaxID=2727404 RepID=A0AAE2BXH7_9LAMI|nr:O-fucosyltransferase 6 [Sesamum angolense]
MSTMKKKKHRDELIGLQILQGLLFRHHQRRRRLHHLLPFLSALSGCLLFLLAILLFLSPSTTTTPRHYHLTLNTSLNKGAKVHMNVEKENVFRVTMKGGSLGRDLWTSNLSNFYYGCSNASHYFLAAEMHTVPNRYLIIATSGGLNQQRTGIVDAVVAAYILNATLVVPKLDQKSFWKDSSNFSEIFDIDWFITYLSKDVKIIKELPPKTGRISTTRAPRKCNEKCYETRILPIYAKKRVQAVQLTKFDYRLSNRLELDLQKLRCRVNYHALTFADPILQMDLNLICWHSLDAIMVVERKKERIRCDTKAVETLHTKNPEKERRRGKCPLSPEEVGLMLRALGFGNDVHIYVASGEVYGGEETLAHLKALFPNFHTKETIASKEELAEFSSYSSRMAALDFIVCEKRYFGHKPTIRPNSKKLYRLFLERDNMTWEAFASQVRTVQIGFMGETNEVKPGKGGFHEHPLPCICETSESRATRGQTSEDTATIDNKNDPDQGTEEYSGEGNDDGYSEDELDLSEAEYPEYDNGIPERVSANRKDSGSVLKPDQPELEESVSD